MKHTILLAALLLGICSWSLPQVALADDAPTSKVSKKSTKGKKKSKKSKDKKEEPAAEEEEKAAELSTVAALLEKAEYLTAARPNLKAEYFIILRSASWCGPCNQEMPSIVEHYKTMKRSGKVELILDSQDNNPGAAVGFLNKYGATFPAIAMGKIPALPNAPGPGGIPNAYILTADGQLVTSGHGALIRQWQQHTIKDEPIPEETPEATEDEKDTEPAVHAAIAKTDFLNAKPNKKAKYYIYLHSASWCGPCKAIMPDIVKEYKKMKRAGVEIILMGHDKDEKGVKAYLKSYKAKFPALVDGSPASLAMPGYTPANGIPNATIVDKDGKVITSGHGSIVLEWKDHCKK